MSELERSILAFERDWRLHINDKHTAIAQQFSMSATCYYQLLNNLLDSPDALRHDPMTVKRLQRMRTKRRQQRSRRHGAHGED